MKPRATARAVQLVSAGMSRKKTIWITATTAKTVRGPWASSILPTTIWAKEATAKTMKASQPTMVAVPAMSSNRSSNIFGRAKVVP